MADLPRAGGTSEADLADQVARDRPIHLAEHQRQCFRIGGQQEPQRELDVEALLHFEKDLDLLETVPARDIIGGQLRGRHRVGLGS